MSGAVADEVEPIDAPPSRVRLLATCAIAFALATFALAAVAEPVPARALALAGLYLAFALSEIVPPFVPTLFLLVATPLALGDFSRSYQLPGGRSPVEAAALRAEALGRQRAWERVARHGLEDTPPKLPRDLQPSLVHTVARTRRVRDRATLPLSAHSLAGKYRTVAPPASGRVTVKADTFRVRAACRRGSSDCRSKSGRFAGV